MFRAGLYPVAFIILGLIYSAYSQSSPCQPAFNIDFDNTVLVTNTLHELGGELRFQNVGMYENQVIDMVVTVARGTSYTTDFPDLNGLSGNFGQINVQNRQTNPQLDGEGTFDFCFTQSNGSSQTITIESFDFTIFDIDGRGDRSFEKFTIDPSQYTEFRQSTNSEVFVQCESNASPPCNPGENICFLSTTSGNAGDNPNNPDDLTPEQQRRSVMFTFRDTSCFQATFAQVCNDGPNTCNVGGNLIFAGTASQLTGDCDTPSPTTPSPTTPSPTIRPPTKIPTSSPTTRPPTKNPTPNPTTRAPTKSPTPDPTTQAPVTPNPTPRPPIATPTSNPTTLPPVETPDPTPSPIAITPMPTFPSPTPVMTPNPTRKVTMPPFQDTRPSYKGDRPTQPTQKSKLYSKKSKSSKGAKSKDMVTTTKSSAQTFKTSKSIRGDKTAASASSTSKKGKKEKNALKSKSKLVISPDSEDQTIKSKKEKSMPKAQSKLSMDSRKGKSKGSSKDASTDQADNGNDDSSSSAAATIDEINMDSEDVLLISGNNIDSTITTTTTTTTITTTTNNDNEQEVEDKEETTATATASDGNGDDPSKTSKDTKNSRRRRRRQRSLYQKSIVSSKQRGHDHHIQTISIPVSGWDI